MIYTPYKVYHTFKTIEADIKGKKVSVMSEDAYEKRISQKNKDLHQKVSDLFNTQFSNVALDGYIRCGFHHFKTFGFDKFFREIVLQEYISRDTRRKRNPDESLSDVMKSLSFVNRSIDKYVKEETEDGQKMIIHDYIFNNIGPTLITWVVWRNIWVPSDVEWEYFDVIKSNWPMYEKNVVKFAPLLDKWRKNMKGK